MNSLPFLILASHPVSREQMVNYLSSVSVGGLLIAGIQAFTVSLAFSVLWLLFGWARRLDSSQYSVPVFAWSLQATLRTIGSFDLGFSHPIFFLLKILEATGVLAVIVALLLMAFSLGRRRAAEERTAGWSVAAAALAVVTVFVDWIFLLILASPLPP